jgi:putative RNA 2'-phosphotransferase
MDSALTTKISKYLSYHLRHAPEKLGLKMEVGGWVKIDELLQASHKDQFPLTLAQLKEVVATNEKQRFSLDETGTKIRANQGHSIKVDLQLNPVIPPDLLYHGTYAQVIPSILEKGLQKMSRHHVHLSCDVVTAQKVGQRRGKPVIFEINAQKMSEDGFIFYCSDNQVWLVDHVPSFYLKLMEF